MRARNFRLSMTLAERPTGVWRGPLAVLTAAVAAIRAHLKPAHLAAARESLAPD